MSREIVDRALGEDVDLRDDGLTVTTEDGTLDLSTGGDLPEGWPSSLPIPSGAGVVSSSSHVADVTRMQVILTHQGDFDAVRAEIEDGIAGTEWAPEGETISVQTDDMHSWAQTYVSGDVTAHVSVTKQGSELMILWMTEESAA